MKLIASDLDGTLFGADATPTPRTVAAVNAVVEAGYVFVAVTGRSYFGGAERVTGAGANIDWFIGSNGGHRLNIHSGELEERLLFSDHEMDRILDDLASQLPEIGLAFEHAAGFTYQPQFVAQFPESFDGGPRRDTTTWAKDDIGKIFVAHPTMDADETIEACAQLVPPGIHVTTSGTTFVEFTPAGGDKALGLSRLCTQLGVDASEVIAFGDNNNDLSMLTWAGRGIAMANATDRARAAADEITESNTDHGVALVLESLLH